MRCGKWLGLLVLCGVSISGYASSEVEIRRSLDEHEFQAVSPLFDLGQTQRFDTYIELYRDGQYLLEQQPEAIKLRIKQKGHRYELSVSKLMFQRPLESKGLWFDLSRRQKWSVEIEAKQGEKLAELAKKILVGLASEEIPVLSKWYKQFHEKIEDVIKSKDTPLFQFVYDMQKSTRSRFVPSHQNTKVRWESKVSTLFGRAEGVLGATHDWDAAGAPRVRYEMEFELEDTGQPVPGFLRQLVDGWSLDSKLHLGAGPVAESSAAYSLRQISWRGLLDKRANSFCQGLFL